MVSATALRCASLTTRPISGSENTDSNVTDFGGENVKSNPGTRSVDAAFPDTNMSPDFGSAPANTL